MDKATNKLVTYILIILLSCVVFNGFGFNFLYISSGLAIMGLSVIAYFSIHTIDLKNKIDVSIVIWSLYHMIVAIASMSVNSIYVCAQHIGIILFFWLIVNYQIIGIDRRVIERYCVILHIFTLAYLLMDVILKPGDSSHEAYIYIGLATLVVTISQFKKFVFIKIIALSLTWAFIAYRIGARAQILSFVLFILLYVLVMFCKKKGKKLSKGFFYIYYVVLNVFPLLYTWLGNSSYRDRLDLLAINLSGARFFSMRDVLWGSVYAKNDGFLDSLFGVGFEWTAQFVRSWESLHNLYVTLFAEGGLILVVLMGLVLCSVWEKLNENGTVFSMMVLSFLIVILYKQSFDVSLIENNLWVAFIVWLVLGLGVGKDNRRGMQRDDY